MEQQSVATTSQTDHMLGLKVMRLTKPHLMAPPFSMGEPWDPIGRALESESNKDIRVGQYAPGIGISEMLELPSTNTPTKGNLIYLGETYRVFVSLSNEGRDSVTDVVLKVEILTPSNRLLLHQSAPKSEMIVGERMDHILSHDVKDMGEHTLVCTVSYTLKVGEEKLLRKLQQFNVAKPLEVRPDFQIIEGDILLMVQIQNVMHHPVFLDVVSFDAAAGFTSTDYNITNNGVSVFGKDDIFNPRTTRQYLYRISPQMSINSITGSVTKSGGVSVGKMDIVWRGQFGERGRIQTGQLKATVPLPPELHVFMSKCPEYVELEKCFTVSLKITNNSDKVMRLRCQLERSTGSGILWCGITNKTLPELPAKESLDIQFDLLPILPGIQSVGPLAFVDVLANQKRYAISKVGQVYVQTNSTPYEPRPHTTSPLAPSNLELIDAIV